MSLAIQQLTGTTLQKGTSTIISSTHNPVKHIKLGIYWGLPETGSDWAMILPPTHVDLDVNATMFDKKGNAVDTVYYKKLHSKDKSILHGGDTKLVKSFNDDQTILVNLPKVHKGVEHIFVYINSYLHRDFSHFPFTGVRITDEDDNSGEVLSSFTNPGDISLCGATTLILAKLTRNENDEWEFHGIGAPSQARNMRESIADIKSNHL